MRDLASNIGVVNAISPAVQAATIASGAIDLIGFNRAAIVVQTGAITGAGDFDIGLSDSDDGVNFSAVDDEYIVGGPLKETVEADSTYKYSYIGSKRYIKVTLTKQGGTSVAAGAMVVKGDAAVRPVAA